MNTKQFLNKHMYPGVGDNLRRKTYPLHDTLAITTGTNEYHFFETALGNRFARNKRFPVAGSEIFILTSISAMLETQINISTEVDNLNELLQQSYLEIRKDNRTVCKLPALDFVNYIYADSFTATARANLSKIGGNLNSDGFLGRKLSVPIIFNSNSSFKFRFKCNTQTAADFNGVNLRLYLNGVQGDKLMSYDWDNLKDNKFEEVPATFYETRAISNGNETTFDLFEDGITDNLQSDHFPLSEIDSFTLEAMEFFVNQPDVGIDPTTIYLSRIQNLLKIKIDEVDYWDSVMGTSLLSMIAGFNSTLTTTPDVTVMELLHCRKQLILPLPLNFPANGKVKIEVVQPASSLGITGEFTLCLRGMKTRRVA